MNGSLVSSRRGNDGAAARIDDVGHRQLAQAGLRHDVLLELGSIGLDLIGGGVDVADHVDDVGANELAVLVDIGAAPRRASWR